MGCDGWGSPVPVRSASICTNFNIVIPFAGSRENRNLQNRLATGVEENERPSAQLRAGDR